MIGNRSQIGDNVTIRNTYMMGADSYEQAQNIADNSRVGRPNLGVGSSSVIENAILDKNVRIGRGV